MKCNKWTLALAAAGVVSLGSVAQAEEAQHQVLTALSSTTLSGYVDTSAIWKPGTDNGGSRLPGHVFDAGNKMDGFNLQRVQLTLEKPLDEGQWSAGYKADLVFGPDADYYATDLNFGGVAQNNMAVKQAYVALRAPVGNGIDIKMGVFDTIIGYEVFETGSNPNFSRSYGYSLEPTHHTGILASYHVADWLSIAGGVANTAFGPINGRAVRGNTLAAESIKAYMGSVTLTLPESTGPLAGSVVYLGLVNGLTGSGFATTQENTSSYYAGATIKTPVAGMSVGAAFDYRADGAGSGFILPENHAYTIAGYLTYAFTEKLHLNDRVDYANADEGTFYAHGVPGTSVSDGREHLLSNTLTLDYSLWDNVITRAEFRWDHSLNGNAPFGSNESPMKNAYILAANIIYKF